MNVIELNEKNLADAVSLYKTSKAEVYKQCPALEREDSVVANHLRLLTEKGGVSFLFTEKGNRQALVSIYKQNAEILHLCVDFQLIDGLFYTKLLDFAVKQFSSVTFVFIWVDSVDLKTIELLENYGFEYTGEQDYIVKEKNLFRFKYVYKRKK